MSDLKLQVKNNEELLLKLLKGDDLYMRVYMLLTNIRRSYKGFQYDTSRWYEIFVSVFFSEDKDAHKLTLRDAKSWTDPLILLEQIKSAAMGDKKLQGHRRHHSMSTRKSTAVNQVVTLCSRTNFLNLYRERNRSKDMTYLMLGKLGMNQNCVFVVSQYLEVQYSRTPVVCEYFQKPKKLREILDFIDRPVFKPVLPNVKCVNVVKVLSTEPEPEPEPDPEPLNPGEDG